MRKLSLTFLITTGSWSRLMKIRWVYKLRDTESNNQRGICIHSLRIMCSMLNDTNMPLYELKFCDTIGCRGHIDGFCRGIKVKWPKTKGQDPKMIKACMKVSPLDVLYSTSQPERPSGPIGKDSWLNRLNGAQIFELSPSLDCAKYTIKR